MTLPVLTPETSATAALTYAETTLYPLVGPTAAGDVVYRALPSAHEETLRRGYLAVKDVFNDARDERTRETRKYRNMGLAASSTLALIALAVTLSGVTFTPVIFALWAAAVLTLAPVGGLAIALGDEGMQRKSPSIATAIKRLTAVDMAGFVEVVNPNEATALALDRAKTHRDATRGDANTRAQQHYYNLLCEVASGVGGTTSGARSEQWAAAWRRWCTIDDAWTDLVCDPFAALTHSELLDVTLPRTAAFITSYAETREAMTGRTVASVPADLSGLLRLIETTHTNWTEAHAHAEHAGYGWLPEAERKIAATAAKALALAADESATMSERANAATKAGALLAQIVTVRLPDTARAELDHLSRKALPPGTTTTTGGATAPSVTQAGPLLSPAREALAV